MNQNLITAIDYKIDINKLQKDTTKVLETYPFNKHNQICFQNTNINYNPSSVNFVFGVPIRKASNPPFFSTVRIARVDTRILVDPR